MELQQNVENKSEKKLKYIAIAGNIGVGKTTLAQKLSKYYQWETQFDTVEDNPYIEDFYNDMRRWSFNLQIYFLNKRLHNIIKINKTEKTVIQDRTIIEDAHVFAPNLHDMGLMSSRDFHVYLEMYERIISVIQPPDLVIYLKASIATLVARIEKRGRPFESGISIDYLSKLNHYYDQLATTYSEGKIITIDCNKLNFENNNEDLGQIIHQIDTTLFGLF